MYSLLTEPVARLGLVRSGLPAQARPLHGDAVPDKGGYISKRAYQMVLSSMSREITICSRALWGAEWLF